MYPLKIQGVEFSIFDSKMQKIVLADFLNCTESHLSILGLHIKNVGKLNLIILRKLRSKWSTPVWPPHNQAQTILNILTPVQQVCTIVYAYARLQSSAMICFKILPTDSFNFPQGGFE